MEDVGHRVSNVAVIGAGWSGLASAVTLADRGVPVTLFEASRQPGGRARRVTVEGIDLDNGQHILIGAYRETLALMSKVGANPDALLLRMPLELRFAEGFSLRLPRLPSPVNLLAAALTARGMSLPERLRMASFFLRLRSARFRVDPDCSVDQLLRAFGQTGTLRRFVWEPLCISALNTPTARASAQVFANVLRDALTGETEASDLLIPRTDLGRLFPEHAMRYLSERSARFEFAAAVRRIERIDGGFRLDADAGTYGEVIVATGAQHAGALLSGFPELAEVRRDIDSLEFEPIYTCYLQYSGPVRLPCPMLGFSGGIVQWAFDRGQLGGPSGLIAAVVSASGAHQDLSQQEFGARVHAQLEAFIPASLRPQWVRVIAEKRASFSCRPGISRPPNRTAVRGIVLAGDYTASDYPATLESAVRSGRRAADIVLQDLSHT